MIYLPDDAAVIRDMPFTCPECDRKTLYVEFDEWEKSGAPTEIGTHVSCMHDEDGAHWNMPYVTLLPLEDRVYRWAAKRYRIVESTRKMQARLAAWNAGEPIRGDAR